MGTVAVSLQNSYVSGLGQCHDPEHRRMEFSDELRLPGMRNKVAIVSGAAQGIGRGICLQLASQGAQIVCVDLPGVAVEGEETARMARELGGQTSAIFVSGDATNRAQVESAFAKAIAAYGRVDISVSVVGGGARGPFLEEAEADHVKTVTLTQETHWHWQQVAGRHMRDSGGGAMVLVGSIMAEMSVENSLSYQSCKAAVAQMGKCMAHELAKHNVRVNVLQPGYIDTPGERKFAREADIQAWGQNYDIPVPRLGTADDIGMSVAFLCSDAAAYITGTVLNVDGGYLCAMALPARGAGVAKTLNKQ